MKETIRLREFNLLAGAQLVNKALISELLLKGFQPIIPCGHVTVISPGGILQQEGPIGFI